MSDARESLSEAAYALHELACLDVDDSVLVPACRALLPLLITVIEEDEQQTKEMVRRWLVEALYVP